MTHPQKEMMNIDEFMEIYGIKRNRFYTEVKKYPWLITKLGNRTHIRRIDADKWLKAIKLEF